MSNILNFIEALEKKELQIYANKLFSLNTKLLAEKAELEAKVKHLEDLLKFKE